jgi:hypothetical protein
MPGTTPPVHDEPSAPEVNVAQVLACASSAAAVSTPPEERDGASLSGGLDHLAAAGGSGRRGDAPGR